MDMLVTPQHRHYRLRVWKDDFSFSIGGVFGFHVRFFRGVL